MPRPSYDVQRLGVGLLRYIRSLDEQDSPEAVLDALHKVTSQTCQLNVLCAAMFPLRWGDVDSIVRGKTVFLHKSVPDGWWEEYDELRRAHPGIGATITQFTMAPFTMSEIMRILTPLGIERWPFELATKYGIRDYLSCPVGGRWGVAYWSRRVLSDELTPEARAILFMGATFAAIRLQKLVESQAARIGDAGSALTPRELAVLRLLSVGNQIRDTANLLGVGEETIRTHLKKAQSRLGVKNRVHAVAQAIRRHLIP
jgi:DNA-binding CsgD family transcriptional regulator